MGEHSQADLEVHTAQLRHTVLVNDQHGAFAAGEGSDSAVPAFAQNVVHGALFAVPLLQRV